MAHPDPARGGSEPYGTASSSPVGGRLDDDADHPVQVARQVRRALWGRDLLGPRPGWWPWGSGGRARAQRRREVRALGAQRRVELHRRFAHGHDQGGDAVRAPWRPIPASRNIAALAAVATVVAAVVAVAWSRGDEPGAVEVPGEPRGESAPIEAPPTTSTTLTVPPSVVIPSSAWSLPEQPPIPPSGVAPTQAHPRTATDPATIAVITAPPGPPARRELADPQDAAEAWLARWCPFTTGEDQFGDAERRALPAMTDVARSLFDPTGDERTARSWEQAGAAGETGRCSAPVAQVVPSAPRTPQRVVVRVAADRVITTAAGGRYVESLSSTRVMLRQADGTWRVDLAAVGG
ncbi:hypothetical protein [Saccharothrix longispora]|uniref:hypothetical protein n=1 Tax=Saccharothrix longispora TaxID=33920 RepID=UPI0028FD42F5|nr:hypothetical protein [Saccharothrix longispora]MDU0293316.1 hypothetical protein [Saccharothrix longispora]